MMILTVLLPLLAGLAAAGPAEVHPLSAAAINHINMQKSTWTAGRNFPEGTTVESLRYLFGVPEDFMNHRLPELDDEDLQKNWLGDFWDWLWGNKDDDDDDEDLPEYFDAREQWPQCAADIGHIRDQGGCGSCWAVAATATMTDRHCIATKGAERFTYSAVDLISCCAMLTCGFGCNGGYPSGAWTHWVRHGIVSGDDYNTTATCKPYPIAPCEHHTDGDRGACKNSKTPKCTKTCQQGYTESYKQDHRKGEKAYSVKRKQSAIMKEIMTHGPVEAAFNVFDDFLNYKSGVYQHVSGGLAGGHAVKMIGWGVENGTPYWLLANSWNTNWGENGFFKILRGKNECGIEGGLTAGILKM